MGESDIENNAHCSTNKLNMTVHLDQAIEQLYGGDVLKEEVVGECCENIKEILIHDPNVLRIQPPVTVVGDIHGYIIFFILFIFLLQLFFCFCFFITIIICCYYHHHNHTNLEQQLKTVPVQNPTTTANN